MMGQCVDCLNHIKVGIGRFLDCSLPSHEGKIGVVINPDFGCTDFVSKEKGEVMDNKEIAKQIREWADQLAEGGRAVGDGAKNMHAFADRLEAEPSSPTLSELMTPEEAGMLLFLICGSEVIETHCVQNERCGGYSEGKDDEFVEPPTSALLCHALWQRAKEGE